MSDDTTLLTSPTKIHWYHRHGDIEIRASGGTILRADSWRLAAASNVFADMLEVTSPVAEDFAEATHKRKAEDPIAPIDLDHSAAIISHFLDLVNQAHPTVPPSNYDETIALYILCDQFDAVKRIKSQVDLRIQQVGCVRQWNLLVFASTRDDLNLAKKAISFMDDHTFSVNRHFDEPQGAALCGLKFSERMAILPESWQLELYRKAFGPPPQNRYNSATYNLEMKTDWAKVALDFNPGQ
ncbi:uncharacterized protein I206_100588 [Kwoniella pini CBS 10737]|uniref:BTB domain-containing protein n=1 Tax=Kwoniella pini CBS 10737 TaxID=1296096 RepID=A0A1B9IDD7_9TREE|nr:uncharacterized protein I206_00737 [Kwoniella pini CBS 10737]OCF53434.1 hypothetical protein I206_00737 [Kwoniella pini CBS 10737]